MKFLNAIRRHIYITICIGCAFAFAQATPSKVQNVGFTYASQQSRFEITFDQPVTFTQTASDVDRQVILEIDGAKIDKKFSRALDTSSYKSNVAIINPYQNADKVRVAFQLIENGSVQFQQEGNKIIALIDNKQPPATSDELSVSVTEAASQPVAVIENTETASAPSSQVQQTIDTFFETQKTKNYVGRKITLQVQDRELSEVFQIISEASEFNIVVADNVRGKVMLNLVDVPWDQALDLIFKSYRLGAERHGNVMRVATISAMTEERQTEVAAKRAAEAAEPLMVKIFPISYADPKELQKILTDFLTREQNLQMQSGGSILSQMGQAGQGMNVPMRGSIQIDTRTNALIVRDTASSLEKIKRIIQELDTQTPQILIEAKFVAVNEDNTKELSGRIFSSSRELNSQGQYAVNNNRSNFSAGFGGPALPSSIGNQGFAVTAPSAGGGAGFGFMTKQALLLPGLRELGAFLDILETESSAKTIASPRIVTQNKTPANLTQGSTFQFATAAGANATGGFQSFSTALNLTVTPQVTNDGSIMLNVDFSQSAPGTRPSGAAFASEDRSVKTQVLVDSGSTLVIGGVYQSSEVESSSGIPFLRDIPIIGILFGSRSKELIKRELFIFISPRILNDKEAGMRG